MHGVLAEPQGYGENEANVLLGSILKEFNNNKFSCTHLILVQNMAPFSTVAASMLNVIIMLSLFLAYLLPWCSLRLCSQTFTFCALLCTLPPLRKTHLFPITESPPLCRWELFSPLLSSTKLRLTYKTLFNISCWMTANVLKPFPAASISFKRILLLGNVLAIISLHIVHMSCTADSSQFPDCWF